MNISKREYCPYETAKAMLDSGIINNSEFIEVCQLDKTEATKLVTKLFLEGKSKYNER